MERITKEAQKEAITKLSKAKIVLLGLPASGKTTLVETLQSQGSVNYVSLGGITREALKEDSPLSRRLKDLFATSEPWPDDFVISIIAPRLLRLKTEGFILDGVPKKASEAIALASWMGESGIGVDLSLTLEVSRDVALSRMLGRNDKMRLKNTSHYETRFRKWEEDRDTIVASLSRVARNSFAVDTYTISEQEVLDQVLEFSLNHL